MEKLKEEISKLSNLEKVEIVEFLFSDLNLNDEEYENLLEELKDLIDWEPITFSELIENKDNEQFLSSLKSYSWKFGNPRHETIGINSVEILPIVFDDLERRDYTTINYSENDGGDPQIYFSKGDQEDFIHKVGDGKWTYGLYKKRKQ